MPHPTTIGLALVVALGLCASASAAPHGWRRHPAAPPVPAGLCNTGYVWRVATAADLICVTPESRALVAQENALAETRRDPNGAYGPMTCIAGFVWREAYAGDVVCVSPARRTAVAWENRTDPGRTHSDLESGVGRGSTGGGSGGGDPNVQ